MQQGFVATIALTEEEYKNYKHIDYLIKDPNFKGVAKRIDDFIEQIDTNNMSLLEAVIVNIFTGKSFVKNSWSEESKINLQQFYINRAIYTQNMNSVENSSTSITTDKNKAAYSLYEGPYESKLDEFLNRKTRLKQLELKIGPLYKEFKEYEELKRELG